MKARDKQRDRQISNKSPEKSHQLKATLQGTTLQDARNKYRTVLQFITVFL